MTTLIMMCGIPGSGKSSYIAHHKKEPCCVISRDEIRKTYIGEDRNKYFDYEENVFRDFVKSIRAQIEKGTCNIYIDATHITPASRRKVLSKIKDRNNLNIEVVYFVCPVETAIARNNHRNGIAFVPPKAIQDMSKSYKVPTIEELEKFGFNSVTLKEVKVREEI